MAPGRRALRKIQWGKESTAGTAVAATALWRGKGTGLDDQREVVTVEEDVGILGGTDRSYISKLGAELALDETVTTFEQIQYLLAMALGGPTTGASDGAGTGKIYTTTVPTTTGPTGVFYTVQAGDDFEVEQLEYGHVVKLDIKGTAAEPLMVSATIRGRQATRIASFTGSIAIPSVENVMTSNGKVYLDAIGGTYGTTQVSSAIKGISLTIEPLWIPKWLMDGNLYWTFPVYTGHKISGSITFEHDTAASGSGGEKANWRAQTARKLQLKFEGSSTATPGTAYNKKTWILNLPIKWTKFDPLSESDGNDLVVGNFASRYNTTSGEAGSSIVVFEAAALT